MRRSDFIQLHNGSTSRQRHPDSPLGVLVPTAAAFLLAAAPAFAQAPVVEWAPLSLTLAEGLRSSATVHVNPAPTKAIRVGLTNSSDDATSGSSCGSGADYVVATAVDIPAGAHEATVPIQICYDAVIESPDEEFTLLLQHMNARSDPYQIGRENTLIVGITESTRTVNLSASPTTVDAGSAVTVTVTPSGAGPGGAIPLSITRGTAEADDVDAPATLSLAAGNKAGTATVSTRADADDDDETFTVALGSNLPLPYTAGSKTSVEITINDVVSLAPPIDIRIAPESFALEVSWRDPLGIVPTGYDVHYAAPSSGESQWIPARNSPTTGRNVRISDLQVETEYRVRVRSRHGTTTSDWVYTKANTWLFWAHSEPRCGSRVTDLTVKPQIALGLSPQPSEDVHTEYRWHGSTGYGKWQSGETIPRSSVSTRKGFDSFADLVTNIKGFNAFEWRRKDLPSVRTICTWTIVPPAPKPEPEPDVTADLSVSPNPVEEGSAVTVTATLSAARSSSVTIPLIMTDASPEIVDYATSGGIEIAADSTSGSVRIQTLQDDDGDHEQFKVQFGPMPTGVTNGTTTRIEITITDDEAPSPQKLQRLVTLSLSPNPVDEGSPITVTATLSEAASASVTVPLTITDNTAEAGDHGTLASISISSGATTGTGTITTSQDDDADHETFTVALGTLPSPLSAGTPSSMQVTIQDDDVVRSSVSLSASPSPVDEGSPVTVTATLSTPHSSALSIPVTVSTGSPNAAESDDVGSLTSITISAGETTGTGTITTMQDSGADHETFTVSLGSGLPSGVGAGTPNSVQVTIRDDEANGEKPFVWVSASPNPVEEGSPVTVTARLDATLIEHVSIPLTVAQQSAEPGDYQAPKVFHVEVPPGQKTGTYAIPTAHDDDADLEQFLITVAGGWRMPSSVQTSRPPSAVRVTIVDRDAAPHVISVSDAELTEKTIEEERRRTGDPRMRFQVTLSHAAEHEIWATYWTEDGTATAGLDYRGVERNDAANMAVVFDPGETQHEIRIRILDDDVEDSRETFSLVLGNPEGAVLGKSRGTGTILNHEPTSLSGLAAEGASSADGPFTALDIGSFAPGTTDYAVTVPHGTTHARLVPESTNNGYLVIRTGPEEGTKTQVPFGGGAGPAVALAVGENVLVVDTQFNGQTAKYRVTITRDEQTASADADLSGLSAEAGADGDWSPLGIGTFSAATTAYAATVAYDTTEARLTATAADSKATLKAGPKSSLSAVTSGTASAAASLQVGANALAVEVTAENGTTKTYTVTVTRKARELSSNANLSGLTAETAADGNWSALDIGTFSEGTTEYSATVPHRMSEARLTATAADSSATLKAGAGASLSTVASGSTSGAIALDVGSNALSVEVTAEDGTTKTYAVRVERSEPPKPLTAEFESVPDEHDGEAAFTLDVRFSEALGSGASVPSAASFNREAGKVEIVEDLGDRVWRVTVQPGSWRDVTVGLTGGRDCGSAGVVCTADGRALDNTIEAAIGGPVRIRIEGGKAKEREGAVIDFPVTLNRASSETVSVDYATADSTAKAGEDYEAVSGTLTFAAGETEKTLQVPILDDDIDEGNEKFEMRLSNESGAFLRGMHKKATGTIRNTDLIPAALLARFGRATAEHVVTHIEERLIATRERGFRARFAGRELRPGQERDFALGLVSQFAQPSGMAGSGMAPMGSGYTAPMGMTTHTAAGGAVGLGATGMDARNAATGMTGGQAPMGGYTPGGARHGGGPLGPMGMGGDLFSNSELELNRESRGGILSLWSRSSRSYFTGMEDALSLNGDVRTTMVGADYSRGALTVGLSVGRTLGLGGYSGTSGGQMTTSMTGVYPWVGYQVNDRVSVWGTTGYGAGALSLTPDAASALETGVSMMMSAVGTRGELVGSRATGGFALAFKADALRVGAASDLVEGRAGRLNASAAAVTRVRTALEGSRAFTLGGGRLSLRPSVEVGLRRDGGDAETGAGMNVGSGLALSDAVTGLSLDVRMRTLVAHQAEGFSDRGMSLSFGWDATPSSPFGLTARVAPSWGGSAQGGAEALWGGQMGYGTGSHQMYGGGDRVDAEIGYGLPVGTRFVGTPRVGLTTSEYGRDYRVGYGLGVLDRDDVNFELGVDAQRRESPMQGEASNGVMGRATLGW